MLIGCFFIERSLYTWREELRTNNLKAKTCLFTGQVDVQHMSFTYVTLYNPDSLDNNLCDKRILAITNLETENKTNKPRKNVLYLLNCAYRLGRLKRQQTSDGLRFLHRSYMRTKQNGGLLLREKQARRLSTRLNKPLTAQRRSHKLLEPSNHWTKNLKSLKNMACCRLMPGSNSSETAVYGEAEYCNATIIAKQLSMATILLCFELFQCRVDVLQS